jgi:hypothetical protein
MLQVLKNEVCMLCHGPFLCVINYWGKDEVKFELLGKKILYWSDMSTN